MELREAFELVLELAESAILTEDQADSEALSKERDRQMDAVDKIENFWDNFSKFIPIIMEAIMAWKVKVYTYNKPEEEEVFQDRSEAIGEAQQINLMQPEGCENLAAVVECNSEGQEV